MSLFDGNIFLVYLITYISWTWLRESYNNIRKANVEIIWTIIDNPSEKKHKNFSAEISITGEFDATFKYTLLSRKEPTVNVDVSYKKYEKTTSIASTENKHQYPPIGAYQERSVRVYNFEIPNHENVDKICVGYVLERAFIWKSQSYYIIDPQNITKQPCGISFEIRSQIDGFEKHSIEVMEYSRAPFHKIRTVGNLCSKKNLINERYASFGCKLHSRDPNRLFIVKIN